jgi:DNA ligase (NAD+)
MDIVGLGPQILRQLADNNLIKEITDLYKLKKEDLLKLEGFAEKKADNLLESIEASKKQPLERLIFALGIPSIGESASFELSQRYRDLDELSKANDMELQAIEGFGPNMVNSIINWFSSFKNKNTIENFKNLGIWPKNEKIHTLSDKTKTLSGLTFVITGTLPNLTRNEISELIVINGGKISSSVSKNTDFLILGENAGSKLNKAQQFNTKILDEKGFLKLLQ